MILYDTKEKKYKLVIRTSHTTNGFTTYITADKEYGIGKCSNYFFITESKVIDMLNSREEACNILAKEPIELLYTNEAFDLIYEVFRALHNIEE